MVGDSILRRRVPPGTPVRYSLRVRLPVIMSAFIAVVLLAFLWVAYRGMEDRLIDGGRSRALSVSAQLANLVEQSTGQRLAELQRAARSLVLRDFLMHSQGPDAPARQRLTQLAASGEGAVELWDAHMLHALSATSLSDGEFPVTSARGVPWSTQPGALALQVTGDGVFWDVVVAVEEAPVAGAPVSVPIRLGYLASRQAVKTAAALEVISHLVETQATVGLGNQAAGTWTDFSRAASAPPVNLGRPGVAEYRTKAGQRLIGALTLVRGTPWAVWVDYPRDVIVAPARAFLSRMLIIALAFVVAAAFLAGSISARITTPLHQLASAAEAIAAGDYAQRIGSTRRDELGRVGAAFDAMAVEVEEAQHELEARVLRRTTKLQESTALLHDQMLRLDDARQEVDEFFGMSLDLLCIADLEGRFLRLNLAWTETLGWSADELMAVPYLDFVHPEDRAAVTTQAIALTSPGTVSNFDVRYRCRDGSYRWLSWKASASPNRGVIYAVARDVTARNQWLADLEMANAELEAFSYSVSHDLRAPLRHISGFAALIQKGAKLDGDQARYLTTITAATRRMGRLIDDLLAFSRMGRAPLMKTTVSLDDLVREVRGEVAAEAAGRRLEWTIHPMPEVKADPAMLRQVLVNLLSNAVKYTATRAVAKIEIGVQGDPPGETVLFVRDNGVGFDMQYVHKLFGVFQRLHAATEFEGTGVGLANVRRIVTRHGGRAWAESAVDSGATFYVSLPTGIEAPC